MVAKEWHSSKMESAQMKHQIMQAKCPEKFFRIMRNATVMKLYVKFNPQRYCVEMMITLQTRRCNIKFYDTELPT